MTINSLWTELVTNVESPCVTASVETTDTTKITHMEKFARFFVSFSFFLKILVIILTLLPYPPQPIIPYNMEYYYFFKDLFFNFNLFK